MKDVGETDRYAGPATGLPWGVAVAVGEGDPVGDGEPVGDGVPLAAGVCVEACDAVLVVDVAPPADALAVALDAEPGCVEVEGASAARTPVWVSTRTDVPARTRGTARKRASAQRLRPGAWGRVT